jgi:hypothetical protein
VLAWRGFAEEAQAGAGEAGAECLVVEPAAFQRLMAGVAPPNVVAERDARRHRGDPLHVWDDRQAEGRRAARTPTCDATSRPCSSCSRSSATT